MQHRVADLHGELLDLAVALAEGRKVVPHPSQEGCWCVYEPNPAAGWRRCGPDPDAIDRNDWSPSTKWEQAGPLIERERMFLEYQTTGEGWWYSEQGGVVGGGMPGPTALIAAMRAFVSIKFGETVDLS